MMRHEHMPSFVFAYRRASLLASDRACVFIFMVFMLCLVN